MIETDQRNKFYFRNLKSILTQQKYSMMTITNLTEIIFPNIQVEIFNPNGTLLKTEGVFVWLVWVFLQWVMWYFQSQAVKSNLQFNHREEQVLEEVIKWYIWICEADLKIACKVELNSPEQVTVCINWNKYIHIFLKYIINRKLHQLKRFLSCIKYQLLLNTVTKWDT